MILVSINWFRLSRRSSGKGESVSDEAGLKMNSHKTNVVPFELDGFGPVLMEGVQLEFSHEMKI